MLNFQTDVSALKTDVAELKADVTALKTDVAELKTDVAVLKTDVIQLKSGHLLLEEKVTEIRLTIENVLEPNICILAENYVPAARRYEQTITRLESIESEQCVMKKVITDHSIKLQNLIAT